MTKITSPASTNTRSFIPNPIINFSFPKTEQFSHSSKKTLSEVLLFPLGPKNLLRAEKVPISSQEKSHFITKDLLVFALLQNL